MVRFMQIINSLTSGLAVNVRQVPGIPADNFLGISNGGQYYEFSNGGEFPESRRYFDPVTKVSSIHRKKILIEKQSDLMDLLRSNAGFEPFTVTSNILEDIFIDFSTLSSDYLKELIDSNDFVILDNIYDMIVRIEVKLENHYIISPEIRTNLDRILTILLHDKKFIDHSKMVKFEHCIDSGLKDPITFEDLVNNIIIVLPCDHKLLIDSFKEMIVNGEKKCPLCRTNIIPIDS